MAFGSGFSAINIIDSKDKYDYKTRNFFRLNNDSPFWIKWKNEDTLMIKCLSGGGSLSGQQPIKREFKKWKDWTFEVEYYSLFSTTAEIKYSFDSYFIGTDFIRFNSKKDSIVFKMDEVQFSLDTGHIFVTQFKVDTFNFKPGIALSHYDLAAMNRYNKNDFLKQQAFLKTKL